MKRYLAIILVLAMLSALLVGCGKSSGEKPERKTEAVTTTEPSTEAPSTAAPSTEAPAVVETEPALSTAAVGTWTADIDLGPMLLNAMQLQVEDAGALMVGYTLLLDADGTATAYVTDTDAFATSLKSYLYTLIPAILEITAQAQGMSYDEFMTEAVKQFGSEEAVYDAVLEQVDFDAILQTGDLPTKDVPTVGTYTIDGDRVTVTLEGDVTEMTLSGNTLTTSEDGVEMVYHREK